MSVGVVLYWVGWEMDFPIVDPVACYRFLVTILHPDGFRWPRCRRDNRMHVHAKHRAPVLDYRCAHCKRVFNAFTNTPLAGTRRPPHQLVLIRRGIAQGTPTAQLARELGCDRMHRLGLRHRLQELAAEAAAGLGAVAGANAEADEMFQNAGGKKGFATRPPTTPRVVGPTSSGGTAPSPTTARRWSGW